jgi:GNAT superfamily N-acetyltransferase
MQDRQAYASCIRNSMSFMSLECQTGLQSRRAADTYEHSELCATLGQIISSTDAAIFVAESGGRLVGLAEVYLRQDEASPLRAAHRYGLLQSLMVKDTFRHQGIGSRLLQAAQRWAQERDAAEMRLDTWEFEAGPLFYEKCGYRSAADPGPGALTYGVRSAF